MKDDYDLSEKIKIKFKGMSYYVMPRYTHHYLDNDYEKFSLQILKNNLSPGSLFVDIGAHYGAYSLYAAQSAGSKVLAIEPVAENFELLNLNVKTNDLGGLITTHNYAASDQNGEAEFNIPWASDSAGFYEHPNAETIRTQKVQMRKIDDVIGQQPVDIIKIDTEGHEVSVLHGLDRTLKANPNVKLIIELNPECLKRAGRSPEELLAVIKSYGKEIYIVDEASFVLSRITDDLDSWTDYIGPDGYCNIYCVPSKGHEYILFVSHSPVMEGAEYALVDQIKALRTRGIVGHVILPAQGLFADRLVAEGIGYSIVPGYTFLGLSSHEETRESPDYRHRSSQSINASAAIVDVAKSIRPTIVANNTIVNPWGYPAAKALGLPLMWMIHEFGDADHNIPFPYKLPSIRRFIVEESELVLCCSDAVRASMTTGDKQLDAKIRTAYNFIDIQAVLRLSQETIKVKKTRGRIQLCMVGTITEGKGQLVAVQALAKLKKKGIRANLWLVGRETEPYSTRLKKEIAALGVKDDVEFVGYKTNPYAYMKAADIVPACARSEAFGRTTAEPMIIGTPVVGSNSGGTAELITDGVTGLLFKPMDADDLAKKIEKMQAMDTSSLTKKARETVTKMLDRQKLLDNVQGAITGLVLPQNTGDRGKIFVTEWLDAISAFKAQQIKDEQSAQELRNELAATAEQLRQVQEELNQVVHSRSWKVTKPLRKTSYAVKKLRGRK